MIGQDDYADELLSAYLDGELSSEEAEQLAQRLARNAEYASRLEALRELQDALRDLPRYRLSPEIGRRIGQEIERLAAGSAREASEEEIEAELLSAYVDGEVSEEERRQVEHALAGSPTCRSQVEELRGLDAQLRSLPDYHLDGDFADRVLRRIGQTAAEAERATLSPAAQVTPARRPRATARHFQWRGFVWTAVTVAAAVVLMVYFYPGQVDPVRPPKPFQSPLTLVHHKLWSRLVLVYDVTVTQPGVERGDFFQLLRRHGIQVLDTVPVSEREQRSLLRCRFLDDAQLVSPETAANLDEIRLYLVYCSARQADAMWDELRQRPEGFGGFFLNLTTRREGDGALSRLCEAAGIARTSGSAVHLDAAFAASRAHRKLGTFGTVGYVEMDLLAPPMSPGESVLDQTLKSDAQLPPDAASEPQLDEDFPCELLFVVRNLSSPVGSKAVP